VLGAWVAAGRARIVSVAAGVAALALAVGTDEHLGAKRLMLSFEASIARIVSFEETPDATIAVADDATGTRMLLIDGFQATDEGPTAHYMTWMGRLPMLLSAHVDRALVICFGTGQTANAVRSEGPGALDVVELEPAVLRAGPLFAKNERVLEDPRVHPIVMDGRAWLRRTDRTYDVVTLEPMPPNFAGVNALYSKDFYELVASRLRPGGVVAQWVPFHLVSPHDAQAIAATFHEVLGDSLLWVDPVDFTGILVGRIAGSAEPIGTAWPGLERGGGRVSRDLEAREIFDAVVLRGDGMTKYAGGGEMVTDDNQLLAYGAKRQRLPYVVPGLADVNLGIVGRLGR
jgi:spermidine synthase